MTYNNNSNIIKSDKTIYLGYMILELIIIFFNKNKYLEYNKDYTNEIINNFKNRFAIFNNYIDSYLIKN